MSEQANANPNPWVVRPSKKREDLPIGHYLVSFAGIEECEITLKTGEKLPKWKFLWEVKTGDFAGKTTDTLTDRDISPDTQAGILIAGLIGRQLKAGDSVKELVEECVGKTYLGTCQKGKQEGKACLRFVAPPPQM